MSKVAIIGLTAIALFGNACGESAISALAESEYSAPVAVGRIESDEIKESSGLAASDCQDVLWTHNDAGSDAFIFAMDASGKHLGTWKIPNARNEDWESISGYRDKAGQCFLLIADIGDNDAARRELHIYRIPEPVITAETPPTRIANALATAPAEVLKFTYADGPRDAETLLVQPQTGELYIVTKEERGPASVHRVKPAFGTDAVAKAEKIGTVSVPSRPEGLLTGGSFSPDGRRAILCDKKGGYELTLPVNAAAPDDIWKQKPVFVNIGEREQGEGVSYARDGLSLFASSEKKSAPIYRISRKQP